MSIITRDNFIGVTLIAQREAAGNADALDNFISIYEPEFLQKALGYEFALLLTAGAAEDPITERWSDILNGKSFTYNSGMVYKFNGIKQLITNYVYWHWLRDEAEQAAGVGTVVTNTENATRVSPAGRQVKAWNEIVDQLIILYKFLRDNDDYPEFDFFQTEAFVKQNTSDL